MPRPLSRAQALENRAFIKVLRRLGNVRLACRELGLKYGTMQHRRKKHPDFAVRWAAALVFAQPRLKAGAQARTLSGPSAEGGFRTVGGEPVVVRLKSGKLQMRRAQPGKLTLEAEQAFLAAVSATCNIRLSAAAVGAAEAAFFRRARKDPAFARELRLALKQGYEMLETGLLAAGLAGSREHDEWRSNEPPAMPPMTANQALQLMYLHHKEARLNAVEPHEIRRRAREPEEAYHERLVRMAEERLRRQQEEFAVAEVARWERGEPPWGPAGAAVRRELGLGPRLRGDDDAERGPRFRGDDEVGETGLPDLAQVTGWSRADPAKTAHDPRRALFGGWRIEDMERKLDAPRRRPGSRSA